MSKRKVEVCIIDGATHQRCCRCLWFKPLDLFSISNWRPHTVCKECKKIYDVEYRAKTKEQRAKKAKIYRDKNRDTLLEKSHQRYKAASQKYIDRNNEYRRRKVKENWFAWEWFHEQARKQVKKLWIHFNKCYLCGQETKIELHHPSYECREMRSIVVPLCRCCHRYVEQHPNKCPHPIDLLSIKAALPE